MLGKSDEKPPRSYVQQPPQERSPPSSVERAAMWFVHDWNRSDPAPLPEFFMARDMVMLYRMVMTYDPHHRIIPHRVDYHWLNATMEWTGPEVLGGASQIQMYAGCFSMRVIDAMELQLGRPPPTSVDSVAEASHYLTGSDVPARAREDDVLRSPSIDPFGHNLTQEEAEVFVSYLTAPYTRIPCVLCTVVAAGARSNTWFPRFILRFIDEDRVGCLFNPTIRTIIERVIFEPLSYFDARKASGDVVTSIPVADRDVLGTRFGVLFNEVQHSPDAVLVPLVRVPLAWCGWAGEPRELTMWWSPADLYRPQASRHGGGRLRLCIHGRVRVVHSRAVPRGELRPISRHGVWRRHRCGTCGRGSHQGGTQAHACTVQGSPAAAAAGVRLANGSQQGPHPSHPFPRPPCHAVRVGGSG